MGVEVLLLIPLMEEGDNGIGPYLQAAQNSVTTLILFMLEILVSTNQLSLVIFWLPIQPT